MLSSTFLNESGKPVYNAEVTKVRDDEDNWANRFQSLITKAQPLVRRTRAQSHSVNPAAHSGRRFGRLLLKGS